MTEGDRIVREFVYLFSKMTYNGIDQFQQCSKICFLIFSLGGLYMDAKSTRRIIIRI